MRVLTAVCVSAGLVLGMISPVFADDTAPDGAKLYKRCAACHLPTGEGVPGAFPPLKNRLSSFYTSEEGRAYLVQVLSHGLAGAITVNGVTYRGFMPAQGKALKNDGIAAVLNYIQSDLHEEKPDHSPFTIEEVQAIKTAEPKVSAQELSKRRQKLVATDGEG
ncbi:c-type cytochrome [Kordiimonas pumila]|uniref:C-type cytochrome n=1 Tax=Kordiimonas pumila TaxID=2161677 RepID=A0ABV7D4L3_9PROT|nr:c-type cytochrome [Kordiimonas pumila]